MKGKKLKLPTAWIQFKGGTMWGAFYKRPTTKLFPEMSYVRYTPAKSPKVCRWRRDEDSTFSTGCDRLGLNIHGLYCQKCGGKIKVAR